MMSNIKFSIVLMLTGITLISGQVHAQNDSTMLNPDNKNKYDYIYDSLRAYSAKRTLGGWIVKNIISKPREIVDNEKLALAYYKPFKGKTIASIEIQALEVFGPTLQDTSRKATYKYERIANNLHTKTNLNIIRKSLLFKVSDIVQPELLYENERIIRDLPYIKDVRFILIPDSIENDLVHIIVLTKDVFSFGVSGRASGLSSGSFEIYNQNVFGAGHEISVGMVGHLRREPYLGFETYYRISNIRGKFINMSVGYTNTFRKEGFSFEIDKGFILPGTKWGGGISALRLFRSDGITDSDPVRVSEDPLNYVLWQFWGGRNIQLNQNKYNQSQLTFNANITHQKFFERPVPEGTSQQYFSNNTFYLGSITWSRRTYMRDQLIYSYGINEDIPEGFKHELVFGYDENEFGNRFYTHLVMVNGNLLARRPGYLYLTTSLSSYFDNKKAEQGLVQFKANYISKLISSGEKRYRLFVNFDYMIGVRRFEVEKLYIRTGGHIRGFTSSEPNGQQRLSLNIETVFFSPKEVYNFNIAFFAFADLAIIGSNKNFILKEDGYSGVGIGIRLHNEYLVLKTLQLRLAFYPHHPDNMGFVGFVLDEQLKKKFYNFSPGPPNPIFFK